MRPGARPTPCEDGAHAPSSAAPPAPLRLAPLRLRGGDLVVGRRHAGGEEPGGEGQEEQRKTAHERRLRKAWAALLGASELRFAASTPQPARALGAAVGAVFR